MRAFIGINVPEDLKGKIASVQEKFRNFDVKLVEPENLHVSLAFLGEIDERKAKEIRGIMEGVCRAAKGFDAKIGGLGAFPDKQRAMVLWLGIESRQLVDFGNRIRKAIGIAGEFEPHLTIGRVKSGSIPLHLFGDNPEIGSMKVSSVKLVKSVLTPKGPKYESVFEARLNEE